MEFTEHDFSQYGNLLLHIPHASTKAPVADFQLRTIDHQLIDYYTDELFSIAAERIHSVVFDHIRTYCDVERMVDDPLEDIGLGIHYNHPSISELGTKADAYCLYQEYHQKVIDLLHTLHDLNHGTLIIDCHSFSSQPTVLNPNAEAARDIDICIGYNEDRTKPYDTTISTIQWYFCNLGYKVEINQPFSNSKTFDSQEDYHTIMIEVNKRLYMNEDTLEKTAGFDKLKKEIAGLYALLLSPENARNCPLRTANYTIFPTIFV